VVADLEYLQVLAEIDERVGPGLKSNLDSVLVLDGASRSAIKKLIMKGWLCCREE
jgi:hypothetical protein